MYVIGIISRKGGSGKTVIATNLARAFQLRGLDVLLVDSDEQGSARDWAAKSEEAMPTTVGVDRPTVHKEMKRIKGYDLAVIDGAGVLGKMLASIIKASDLVLIPVQPSSVDLWAVGSVVDHVLTRQELTEGRPEARFVLSRRPVGSTLGSDVRGVLEESELPVLDGTCQRVAYARAIGQGLSVLDLSDDKAKAEITSLADSVEDILLKNA